MREWTADMGCMGIQDGEYELLCRKMFLAALDWLEAHPNRDPQFSPLNGSEYGLRKNEDARELWKVLTSPWPASPTAVTQVVLQHVMYARTFGWEQYKEHMLHREEVVVRYRKRMEEIRKQREEEAKAAAAAEAELEKEAAKV